jgi:hypothetical protein
MEHVVTSMVAAWQVYTRLGSATGCLSTGYKAILN